MPYCIRTGTCLSLRGHGTSSAWLSRAGALRGCCRYCSSSVPFRSCYFRACSCNCYCFLCLLSAPVSAFSSRLFFAFMRSLSFYTFPLLLCCFSHWNCSCNCYCFCNCSLFLVSVSLAVFATRACFHFYLLLFPYRLRLLLTFLQPFLLLFTLVLLL